MRESLPVGKLPAELLARLLARVPNQDASVRLGPGIGLDCAVLDIGDRYLVLKSDPITFASDEIGSYLVHVNANDIATTGAVPRWLLVTALLPEDRTPTALVEKLFEQVIAACREIDVSLIGGHTEITATVAQPVLVGTMLGEVEKHRLVTPRGARPGDLVILTKGVPIEATSLLAREFPRALAGRFSQEEISLAANFIHNPGISVLKDARLAMQAGQVTAMHDPTEGGLAAALWELAEACGKTLLVDLTAVSIPDLSKRLCEAFGIDPLAAIASGALLLTASPYDGPRICQALIAENIPAQVIGRILSGKPQVLVGPDENPTQLLRPARDEIARLFEKPPTWG
jgi:hydrogenase expression/formation protein HypE